MRETLIQHAQRLWPEEACGLIVLPPGEDSLAFVPCENRAANRRSDFVITDPAYDAAQRDGTLRAVFHSHPAGQLEPSYADMQAQIAADVPFVVCTLSDHQGTYMDLWAFGDQMPVAPLLSRPFRSGVTDCYAAYRDFNWLALGIAVPNFPRDPDWWDSETASNPFEEVFNWRYFDIVDDADMQPGDGLLFALRGGIVMHCGAYIGDGLFLHHLHGKISRRDPFVQWRRFHRQTVRFRGNT